MVKKEVTITTNKWNEMLVKKFICSNFKGCKITKTAFETAKNNFHYSFRTRYSLEEVADLMKQQLNEHEVIIWRNIIIVR